MTKISDLTALTGAGVDSTADLLPIVDMSAAGAARNKKITVDEARIGLGLGTAASPQFTGINLGHASDTTITRASAGVVAIEGVNIVTTAGGVTFADDIIVPAEAYDATNWNGSNEVPTKNDVRDKIEDILDGVTFSGDISVPDEAYDATNWNGSLEVPTKNAVRDKFESLSGGSAASTTEQLTGTDTVKFATSDSVAALWEQGADVASAGTTSLGEGGYFHVTGTTTITDIDFATDKAGRTAWVEFTGALTLTHNASTLILPTGANITTAAGDTACFVSEGSDVVRCVAYNRANGAGLRVGTSFPGSPATNDRFYRTDRAIEYFYDGTRWLSTFQIATPLPCDKVMPVTDNFSQQRYANPYCGLYDIYVERFCIVSFPTTTTASNYFSCQLHSNSGGADTNIGSAISTQSVTQNAWNNQVNTPNSVVASTVREIGVNATETGTCSSHLLATIVYRLVG